MGATIFYYTGTGNSLWTARKVADELGDAELFSIAEYKDENKTITSEIVGLVFPVHIWGIPGKADEPGRKKKRDDKQVYCPYAVTTV